MRAARFKKCGLKIFSLLSVTRKIGKDKIVTKISYFAAVNVQKDESRIAGFHSG